MLVSSNDHKCDLGYYNYPQTIIRDTRDLGFIIASHVDAVFIVRSRKVLLFKSPYDNIISYDLVRRIIDARIKDTYILL